MKIRFLILCAVLMLAALFVVSPALATPISATYQVTFGNAPDGTNVLWSNYSMQSGTVGSGYASSVYLRTESGIHIVGTYVNVSLPPNCKVGSISYSYRYNDATAALHSESIAVDGNFLRNTTVNGSTENTWNSTPTVSYSDAIGSALLIASESRDGTGGQGGYTNIDDILFGCTFDSGEIPGGIGGGSIKPIKEIDTDSVSEDLTLITTADFVNVYAVTAGVIDSMIETQDGWHVVIAGDDGSTVTYTGLSEVYITETGAQIDTNCLIGLTGYSTRRKYKASTGEYKNEIDFSWMDIDSEPVDWSGYDDPSGENRCADQSRTANCINNNPNLDNKASGWKFKSTSSDQIKTDGEFLLHNLDYISQNLVGLTDDTEYTVTVYGYADAKSALEVSLANALDNQTIAAGESFRFDFSLTPTDPTSLPDVYLLKLTGKGGDIHLDFVCIHTEEIVTPPAECYFKDWQFQKLTEWDTSGGAALTQGGLLDPSLGGYAQLPDASSISSDIVLYSDGTADAMYTLTIWARLAPWAIDIDGTDDWTIAADIDTGTGTEDLGTFHVTNFTGFFAQSQDFTIPGSETWAGSFELIADNTAGSQADQVEISGICITPEGGTWPGYDAADYSTIPGTARCVACVWPGLTLDIGAYIAWLSCMITNIWWCYLYKILVQIGKDIYAILGGFGMLMRFFAALITNFGNWLPKLVEWGAKKISAELAWIGGVWWQKLLAAIFGKEILDYFELSKVVAQALKDLSANTFDALINIWKLIAAMLKSFIGMYGNLIAAWQGSDVENPGFTTDCAVLSSSDVMYPVCVGLSLVDYAVTAFPAAVALLVVIHGVIDYFMLTRSFLMIKGTIQK